MTDVPGDWMNDAACRRHPPEWWFDAPVPYNLAAIAICARCEVITSCGEYADANDEHAGIWAGRVRGSRTDKVRTRHPSNRVRMLR